MHPLAPFVLAGVLAALVAVALGRGDALWRGRRRYGALALLGLVWVVRFAV